MTYDILPALALFAFTMMATPGPNNVMLLTSGANFGYRRTFPHMCGIALGLAVMNSAVGFGLKEVFTTFPITRVIMTILCLLALLYLAWKIINAGRADDTKDTTRPMYVYEAMVFQWINPKAWMMSIMAITIYASSGLWQDIALVTITFAGLSIPTNSIWVMTGVTIRQWLENERRLRIFNTVMAILLLASAYVVVY